MTKVRQYNFFKITVRKIVVSLIGKCSKSCGQIIDDDIILLIQPIIILVRVSLLLPTSKAMDIEKNL
jgi:hypothetical protein